MQQPAVKENIIIKMTPGYWQKFGDEIREIVEEEIEKGNMVADKDYLLEFMRTGKSDSVTAVSYNPVEERIEAIVCFGPRVDFRGEKTFNKYMWYSHPKISHQNKCDIRDYVIDKAKRSGASRVEFVTYRNPRAFRKILRKHGYEQTEQTHWIIELEE